MEIERFISESDDFDAEPSWQTIGDICRDIIRGLLAEAGGSESASRDAGEVSGTPRAQPVEGVAAATGEGE